MIEVISRSAELSPCGRYRYKLTRTQLFGAGDCVFVMLNPSTADHEADDQTVRNCMGFVAHWGYHRLVVVNLYAWRATIPKQMFDAIDPIGPDGDAWILGAARGAQRVVCAWGDHGRHRGRGDAVRALLKADGHDIFHLGLTERHQQPRHPLYLARATPLTEWL